MSAVLARVRYLSANTGAMAPALDQGAVGNQTDVWPDEVNAGRVLVPSGRRYSLQTLGFSAHLADAIAANTAVAQVPGAAVNCGLAKLTINGTDRAEIRVQGNSLPAGSGWEDMTQFWQSSNNLPLNFHNGFTVPSGEVIAVSVTPGVATPTEWRASIVGMESGAVVFLAGDPMTYSTTAGQVVLTYTPSSTFTMMGFRVEGQVIGPVMGVARSHADGLTAIDFGRVGMEQSAVAPLADTAGAGLGYGVGGIFLNLWGMSFYPGQSFGLGVLPWSDDDDVWQLLAFGNDAPVADVGTFPAVGDVQQGSTYGPTGSEYTGTFAVPAEGDVRSGTTYGAGGTEFTGTLSAGGGGAGVVYLRRGR